MVGWENDKPTVVALREIAEGKINQEVLDAAEQEAEAEAEELQEDTGESNQLMS
jgi:DNA-directed RNA polymerase subunit omega